MTDHAPFSEMSHADAVASALRMREQRDAALRERDRLAVENAVYRERYGPLPPLPHVQTINWPRDDCADHLVDRYRPAEGAAMPVEPPAGDLWHIGAWIVIATVVASVATFAWVLG